MSRFQCARIQSDRLPDRQGGAAKVALGKGLDEIANAVTGTTTAAHEPTIDYVVLKIPRAGRLRNSTWRIAKPARR